MKIARLSEVRRFIVTIDWTDYWAARTRNLKASAIRELLKLTARPEVISFAGGLPATETLPIAEITAACDRILTTKADKALQYGPTEGYTALRDSIAAMYRARGVPVTGENVLITTGSQQGLDLVGRTLIDRGDPVVTEAPTYIGALQAWRTSEPAFIGLPLDDEGMQLDLLDLSRPIKLLYALPNFQNPTGVTLSDERRRDIVELAHRHRFVVIEDDPYRSLRYTGKDIPALVEIEAEMLGSDWDSEGRIVHLGTFSKILAPGLRVGWILAPTPALRMFVLAKQGADLHSSMLSQYIADELLRENIIEKNMPLLIDIYRKRRDTMLMALSQNMLGYGTWTRPDGGLFVWLTVDDLNTQDMMALALSRNVAYVPGSNFYFDDLGMDAMRLNFSCMPPEKISEGIARLGALVAQSHGEMV
jgi:2-aminoadipate transaminase